MRFHMTKNTIDVPVMILFFTRQDTLKKVFDSVKEAKPQKIFLFQDGPRNEKEKKIQKIYKMKRNVAIVAGGDSSEIIISLKSAEGIYSFLDKNKYNVYIAILKAGEWIVKLPNGKQVPIDKNNFSFKEEGETKQFDFAYITIPLGSVIIN